MHNQHRSPDPTKIERATATSTVALFLYFFSPCDVTVTLSLVPITMHLPSSLQVSQSATQCMMTQKCSSACNIPYDLAVMVASYQPQPSYFYPTGKTRASMPTEHWCEMTQNTAPRLTSSPRQNSHMQCEPRGRVYNVISPTTPGAWILLLSGTKKQNSV